MAISVLDRPLEREGKLGDGIFDEVGRGGWGLDAVGHGRPVKGVR